MAGLGTGGAEKARQALKGRKKQIEEGISGKKKKKKLDATTKKTDHSPACFRLVSRYNLT